MKDETKSVSATSNIQLGSDMGQSCPISQTNVDMTVHEYDTYTKEIKRGIEALINSRTINSSWEERKWVEGTYINCDLRYFNLDRLGKFDIILIDPPWRIRGGENVTDEKTMFTNNKFYLQYNTLSNEEILDLDVDVLSDRGYCFLWTINSQLPLAMKCLKKWGYVYVDQFNWIKKTVHGNLAVAQGYYFLHSSETCLIGVKLGPNQEPLKPLVNLTNDIIFSEVKKQSQKPHQLYEIIEFLFPVDRKIELFGRNHNIRKGWLTVGNQLGKKFNCTFVASTCVHCKNLIFPGHIRFKHRSLEKNDACFSCFQERKLNLEHYFKLENAHDEILFHDYYECNSCKFKPLWGIRFSCIQCGDLDLCEDCYDQKCIPEEYIKTHIPEHSFDSIEVPLLAGGLSIHKYTCAGCETYPILGYRFTCTQCSKISLCQKCFFLQKEPKNHSSRTHEMELFTDPQFRGEKYLKCVICNTSLQDMTHYKCNNCVDYDLCHECHDSKKPPPINHVSHRTNHIFSKILVNKK